MTHNISSKICGNCGYEGTYNFTGYNYCSVCGAERSSRCAVCRGSVDENMVIKEEIDGRLILFCCQGCRKLFEQKCLEVTW